MPAIITNKFRINNAQQFEESFSETANTVYYLGIGRPQAFGTLNRGDSRTDYEGTDSNPITPGDTVVREFYTFDDLIAAKRIQSTDVSFVIPRRNWTSGTVYDIYRHDYGEYITGSTTTRNTANSGATTLFDSTFYVLASNNSVYKCLDNNGGATATDEPTGTGTAVISTSDGYKWKFMYTLSSDQRTNFLSTDFMAITTNANADTAQNNTITAAVDGSLDVIKIKSAGSGGTNGTYTNINIRGDYAINGGSRAKCSVTVSGGQVTAVSVTSAGSGYTFGTISNANIVSAGATGLSGAELDVIIPPKGGHGANALEELGGFFVMLNTSLEGTEASNTGDFSTANDFRKIALLRDPTKNASAVTGNTARLTKAVVFAASPAPGTFTVDEEINQASTGAVGKVVEYDSTNRILYYIQTRHGDAGIDVNGDLIQFTGANVITGQSSSATGTPDTSVTGADFSSGYSNPEIDHDTGDILYVENRTPLQRASDQTENIKLVIEF